MPLGHGQDGAPNALIGSTTAEVSVHGRRDFLLSWLRIFTQEGRRTHDLSRLAVTALRDLFPDPRQL